MEMFKKPKWNFARLCAKIKKIRKTANYLLLLVNQSINEADFLHVSIRRPRHLDGEKRFSLADTPVHKQNGLS